MIKYLLIAGLVASTAVRATDVYVDHSATAGGDGSFASPFQTIQVATDTMTGGDTCHIRGGTYRETLNLTANGSSGSEITFTAYQDENVVISGLDPLAATWTLGSNGIWQTSVSNNVHPLLTNNWAMVFIGDTPCVEARWPNMKYTENWIEEKKWAQLDEGPTEYGKLVCSQIGASGLNFDGATLHMKWLKNDFASRTVTNHTPGQDAVFYPQKHDHGNPDNIPKGHGGYDPRFYIDGKLALLDAAEEWFYDSATQTLYLKTPGSIHPAGLDIGIKARRYGIVANEIAFTRFETINLFASSFRFGEEKGDLCRNITLRDCSVLYPDENHFIDTEAIGKADLGDIAQPLFCVEDGWIEECEFGWSEHRGLSVWVRGTTITNCVFHDTALNGQMSQSGVRVQYGYANPFAGNKANTITHSTVYNSGGVAIYHMGPGPNEVLYNHCFNAGLYAGDISVLYLPYGLKAGGTVVARNWVHWAPHGLGMRCDTLGNNIAVHHNVVWDCNRGCKWQGYGPFQVNNNTYYSEHLFFDGNDETNGVDIMNNSDVMNNVFTNRLYFRTPDLDYASHPDENNGHFKRNVQVNKFYAGNIYDTTNLFISVERNTFDLRPKAGSVLIDNGAVVPGVTDGYQDTAPDIGAYEYGGEYWVPGADWLPDGRTAPYTMAEATELAARILAGETQTPELQIEYLIVAGGGGGGARVGGGGGAGGLVHNFGNPFTLDASTYPVEVGAGGAGGSGFSDGENGGSSSAFGQTAFGGGGGGQRGAYDGLAGGSGGGAGYDGIGGTGNLGQGFNGGDGNGFAGAGGGGGAGAPGQGGNVGDWHNGGNGGAGFGAGSPLGTTVGDNGIFGGGGGGGFRYEGGTETAGTGGMGGGGNGGDVTSGFIGAPGLPNTGGGGGGGSNDRPDGTNIWHDGAAGGSGVVVLRYPKSPYYDQASGGLEVDFSDGTNTYRIHIFTSNGTFTVNETVTANGTPLAWLEQYYPGMDPTEADESDTDGDGLFAWQEYIADTNPTNTASVLKLTTIQPEAGGIRIDWQGGGQARQYLEYTANLPANTWVAIYTNEPVTAPTNMLVDSNAGGNPGFYRIQAERVE
ncbi:right-handed parallel beta-helix repeat-containing protein [Pontiella sulfatireligans]|uniref:Glycine-rich domain-containing protein n=1 Tax=Pontiella sulfatireligans TaxID=2750658 RepID=A0A6C2UDR5_9BACT|nr:right-handed parallel beta-helix repeat-containing protein [Pontiella sulfatireligans]VGO18352.1 hypothetical protein SCARR_00404 [Pontiella sulfatireligans]